VKPAIYNSQMARESCTCLDSNGAASPSKLILFCGNLIEKQRHQVEQYFADI
jgi:hypothetical protein